MLNIAEKQDVELMIIKDSVNRLREELGFGTIHATLEEIELLEFGIEECLKTLKKETEDFLSA